MIVPTGNRTSDNSGAYTINTVNQIPNTGYAYDANGNLTANIGRTYEWDAANRLTAINYPATGTRTEFTYDGLSRRVRIVEKGPAGPVLNMVVQPPNKNYGTYTSSSFSITTGTYTLTLQGLNPNGGDNTMLVDAVKLNSVLVPNGGFETPALSNGSYVFNPTGATWTFTGTTGIARNNSAFTNNNPSDDPKIKTMLGSVARMMWYSESNGQRFVGERGLIIRPKIIKVAAYQMDYDALIQQMNRLIKDV